MEHLDTCLRWYSHDQSPLRLTKPLQRHVPWYLNDVIWRKPWWVQTPVHYDPLQTFISSKYPSSGWMPIISTMTKKGVEKKTYKNNHSRTKQPKHTKNNISKVNSKRKIKKTTNHQKKITAHTSNSNPEAHQWNQIFLKKLATEMHLFALWKTCYFFYPTQPGNHAWIIQS